jgi:hypothetical protein
MINANAYVNEGKLYVLGTDRSEYGVIPFGHIEPCDSPDTAVDMAGELAPEVKQAIDDAQRKIMNRLERQKMKIVGEELVLRTRAGDQVAMALLTSIGENARKGNARAKYSMQIIEDYNRKHPEAKSRIGADIQSANLGDDLKRNFLREINTSNDNLHYATLTLHALPNMSRDEGAVLLSNGPVITDDLLQSVSTHFNGTAEQFHEGVKNWGVNPPNKVHAIGQQFGLARCIQLIRLPEVPISMLSPTAGWELGE